MFDDPRKPIGRGVCRVWLLLLLGCGDSSATSPPSPPATVLVSPATAALSAFGDTVRFSAEVRDQRGQVIPDASVDWSTSDITVAAGDGTGLVMAVANGSATVTAVAGAASGTAIAVVRQLVAEVEVFAAADTLTAGDTLRLSAEASDANGHRVGTALFAWHSTDVDVATVDQGGLVRALAAGTARITAAYAEPQLVASATIAVVGRPEPNKDRFVLEAFHRATEGSGWTRSTGWLTDAPLGEWHGVETDDDGRVIGLRLPENNLVGAVPAELEDLSRLETLNLHGNELKGRLPAAIGNLARLRELDLGHTELSGEIPATLGQLVDLRILNLEYVPFIGSIPSELGALARLEILNLHRNRLTGALPAELGNLRSLQTLYIDNNGLTGSIPATFTRLESIETFYWGGNGGLCAPGTSAFEAWRGDRNVRGPRCNDADLAALEILYNRTDGANWSNSGGWPEEEAPENRYGIEADSLGRVTTVDLSNNGLRASLPQALGELEQLSVLRVGGNPLSGPIPHALSGLALEEFRYAGTEVCEPRTLAFQRWLYAIPVREGTDEQCEPLSERAVLEALYLATGGDQWSKRITRGQNHGRRSRKFNRDCTIRHSCQLGRTLLDRARIAGKPQSNGGNHPYVDAPTSSAFP